MDDRPHIWITLAILSLAMFLASAAIIGTDQRRQIADKSLQTQIDDIRANRTDDAARLAEAIDQGILALEDLPGTIRQEMDKQEAGKGAM
jgi:hypothetical protein